MAELDLRQVSTTLLGLEQEVRASLPTLATTPSEQQADAEGAKLRGIVQKLEDSIQVRLVLTLRYPPRPDPPAVFVSAW